MSSRDFLEKILNNNFSDTVNETLALYEKGMSTEEIAKQRDIIVSTVQSHYAKAIEAGMLKSVDVLDISKENIQFIENMAESLRSKESKTLKPLYHALEETWDYGALKCVLAGM